VGDVKKDAVKEKTKEHENDTGERKKSKHAIIPARNVWHPKVPK